MLHSVTCYADRRKRYSLQVCSALAEGTGGIVVQDQAPRAGIALVHGMADWQKAVIRSPLVDDWWQVDHGYWRRREFYRISHRALWCSGRGEPDYARLDQLGIELAPARQTGRDIVIAVQSPEFYRRWVGVDAAGWVARVRSRLAAVTDRPIVVRQKPLGRYASQPPLERALRHAWALVTHSSSSALDALAAGVPVVVTESSFCAARLATPLEQIERLYRPDAQARRDVFAKIAACQFSLSEMRSGAAWERLHGDWGRIAGDRPGAGDRPPGGDPRQGGPAPLASAVGADPVHRPAG